MQLEQHGVHIDFRGDFLTPYTHLMCKFYMHIKVYVQQGLFHTLHTPHV